MKLWNLLTENWDSLIAALVAGGGGVIGGKKLIDKNQDLKLKSHGEKLKSHGDRIFSMEKKLAKMENNVALLTQELRQNAEQDKDFKVETRRLHDEMKQMIGKVAEGVEWLTRNRK